MLIQSVVRLHIQCQQLPSIQNPTLSLRHGWHALLVLSIVLDFMTLLFLPLGIGSRLVSMEAEQVIQPDQTKTSPQADT